MTQEIKSAVDKAKYELHLRQRAAIEQAAENHADRKQEYSDYPITGTEKDLWHIERNGFVAGAETVIADPERFGLCDHLKQVQAEQMSKDNLRLIQENAKYREALEKITQVSGNPISSGIAKEALKQEQ